MYEVHIYIWHSPEYASALLSSSYTSQVNDILQRIPSFDDYHVDCRHFVLRQKLEGSTPLSFLRLIIAEEAGIPRSLQSYFRPEPIERGRPWGDTLSDAVDLNDLQAFSQNRRGRIHLYMSTTAQTLKDIVSLHPGSGDGIVGQILAWRHYVSALKYLKKANEKSIIQKNKNNHNKVLRKNEKMERKSAEAVRTMFHHWDRLVRGVEQLRTVPDPGETMEAREQDVETRYRQFILEKKETLARLWAKTSMVSVDGTSLPNQQASSEHSRNSPIVLKTSGKKGAVESGLEFDFPEATEKITINPLRTESGHLLPNSSSFKLRSGVLLWGQLHTVFAGSISKTFQGNANSVPQQLPGGTIEQYELNYRSAARNGEWKVRKAYHIPPPWTAEEPTAQFGWIIYHEAVDPLRALDRCSRISPSEQGKSRGNAHVDKDVFYIGRYDLGDRCDPESADEIYPGRYEAFLQNLTGVRFVNREGLWLGDIPTIEDYIMSTRHSQFMMALDADGFSHNFMQPFLKGCPATGGAERIFKRENDTGENFGAFVSMPGTEYECGWLLFSGKKHDDFPDADELVAVIYDGCNSGLQSHIFAVEGDV